MAEKRSLNSEIKLAIKKKGLQYKLKKSDLKDSSENSLVFVDATTGAQVRGKIVRSFNEGEVYHWPLLNHDNLAPLIEILHIRDDLVIFFTADQQITLKNIVHDEDFVYDPRCFNRKRMYARDIFSGLSYLHAKSLCLMNLSDDNIFISKLSDKAIITDFSHLTYLQKTTRCRLCIPEVYKAPETEKGEFDAIPAEMWASGALMLEVFLAHMVPWAVIDFKAKRVIEIVEKLSLEVLQAANPGSIVSSVDLAKLKAFLKCFFRQKPLMRISAKHAEIASFLTLAFHDNVLKINVLDEESYTNEASVWNMQARKFPSDDREYDLDVQDFTQQIPNERFSARMKTYNDETLPKDFFYSYEPYDDLTKKFQAPLPSKWHILPTSAQISLSANEHIEDLNKNNSSPAPEALFEAEILEGICSKIDVPQKISSINITNSQIDDTFNKDTLPFTSSTTTSTTVDCQKLSNRYHGINEKSNLAKSTTCYESKSLSFIKSQTDLNNNTVSIRFRTQSACSCLNTKTTLEKHFSLSKLNSSLYLDRLFISNSTTNISEAIDVGTNEESQDVEIIYDSRNNRTQDSFQNSITKSNRFPKTEDTTLLLNKPDIRLIIAKIIFLRKCQLSVRMHLNIFISEEFTQKQGELLKKYQIILHQENIRLCDVLRKKYKLSIEDIITLMRNLNSERRQFLDTLRENMLQTENRHKFHEGKCLEPKRLKAYKKNNVSDDEIFDGAFVRKPKRRSVGSKRLNRRFSYCRAIEASEKQLDEKWKLMGTQETEILEEPTVPIVVTRVAISDITSHKKLTEPTSKEDKTPEQRQKREISETTSKNDNANCTLDLALRPRVDEIKIPSKGVFERCTKEDQKVEYKKVVPGKVTTKAVSRKGTQKKGSGKDTKKEKINKKERKGRKEEKNVKKFPELKKLEQPKKSFFFSLCPGGKVEKPTPILDTLCETCKLNLEAI